MTPSSLHSLARNLAIGSSSPVLPYSVTDRNVEYKEKKRRRSSGRADGVQISIEDSSPARTATHIPRPPG